MPGQLLVGDGGAAARPSLILSAPTLVPHRSPLDATRVRALVDAAADAGFDGMSMWTAHYDWVIADGCSLDAFFGWHRERGLRIPAAEVVLNWATRDADAVAAANAHLIDVAARAGATTVIAATLERERPPIRDAVAGLAALCDLAADRGLAVSFEFLPFTGVPTIRDAVALIDAVDRDNLGLVIDAWHWHRQPGGPDISTLRSVPAERIHLLQLDDVPARAAADPSTETLTMRLLPGEGVVDLLGLLNVLDEMEAQPVIVSEVFSAKLSALDPAQNARRQYAAARTLLARHNGERSL